MTKVEQISREAAALTEDQLEATLEFIRAIKQELFLSSAPTDALESLERGRQQIARGEYVELDELSRRLEAAAKPRS